jgi:hypothetical protein
MKMACLPIYFNGKAVSKGKKSKSIVHPAPDKAYLNEVLLTTMVIGANLWCMQGALSEEDINKSATGRPPLESSPFIVEIAAGKKPGMLIRQNGNYRLHNNLGETLTFAISGIEQPIEINGSWEVNFPPNLGAPAQIILPELMSLHRHSDAGVKYFSGAAIYTKTFSLADKFAGNKRWLLDLGSVEVIADVILNGNHLGTLWNRPYQVDITEALQEGSNKLEVSVTNLWPNRLIGDEQLPDPDKFTPGGGTSGREGLIGGYIEQLPDWYLNGQPKPADGRITFATWKHYTKDSPLLESGLIGPVRLLQASNERVVEDAISNAKSFILLLKNHTVEDRRKFIQQLIVTAGAFSSTSLFNQLFAENFEAAAKAVKGLSAQELAGDEDYWAVIQQAYTVNPNIINLNNGGVSPSPRVVQEAVERYNKLSNEGPSYFMWRILDQGREPLRRKLAELGGCDAEEIAFNRNATEALNTVIYGLDLKPGDEVIGTKQDYPNMIPGMETTCLA